MPRTDWSDQLLSLTPDNNDGRSTRDRPPLFQRVVAALHDGGKKVSWPRKYLNSLVRPVPCDSCLMYQVASENSVGFRSQCIRRINDLGVEFRGDIILWSRLPSEGHHPYPHPLAVLIVFSITFITNAPQQNIHGQFDISLAQAREFKPVDFRPAITNEL